MQLLRDLDLFVALGKSKSFSVAAQTLGMPTSTLSRRIAEYEKTLGVALFLRTTRRVELTEAGVLFLSRCEHLVEAAREAQEELQGIAGTPGGLLRISLEPEVGVSLFSASIAAYRRRYPDVTLNLDLSPRRVDLISEGFDLAVRLGPLPDSNLIVRELGRLPVGLYAATRYLRERGMPEQPADLSAHSRLHLLHRDDYGDWELRNGRRRHVVAKAGAVVCANNMTMLRSLLRQGLGIAVMDDVMASEDIKAGLIRPVLPEWRLPPVAVSILRPGRLMPMKAKAFIDTVLDTLSFERND